MSILQAFLISMVYFLANLTIIGVGFFTILRPMVAGFLVGCILGDPVLGTQIGASVNLMYMGNISAGGSISSDSCMASIMAVSLGITAGLDIATAMAIAVPLGILGTFLWFGRLSLGALFVPLADRYAAEGKADKFWIVNVALPQAMLFCISAVPCFIIVYIGTDYIQGFLNFLGQNVLSSLMIIGKMLPALGLGITLKAIFQGHARVYFFLGFLLIQYFGLSAISIGFVSLILAIMYIQTRKEENLNVDENATKFEIKEQKTSGLITHGDLVRSCVNWTFHAQGCYNYERMQGLGFCHAMVPIFKKFYKDDQPAMAAAMSRHTEFFNTAPQFAAMIPGLVIAMEEQRFMGASDIDDESITAVKTSLMGPLSGIGDTVTQGVVIPLLLTFFVGMGVEGNILGPILYTVIITIIVLGFSYFSFMLGYRKGNEAILSMLESGVINKFIDGAKVMGCIVIGGLVAKYVTVSTGLVFTISGTEFNLQTQLFDVILPGMVPLLITLGCYKLATKGFSMTKVMFLMLILGIIGGLTGILV